ncbi:MAG TPA: hypothetical protein VK966_10700 [Longimicrobiales bacterium]|nr:hypothetical protein [Longimicrobiales bacterium]
MRTTQADGPRVRADRPPVGRAALFFSLLGGPVAWTAHLLASYPLVPPSCEMGSTALLNVITAGTALLSAAAGAVGWWAYRRLKPVRDAEREVPWPGDDPPFAWARFMAVAGAVLGAFFAYVILVEGLPPILQDPCISDL